MATVDVRIDGLKEIELLLSGITNAVPKVLSRAVNRAAESTETKASKLVRAKLNMTVDDSKIGFYRSRASYSKPSAIFRVANKPYPFIRDGKNLFGLKILKRGGASILIKKGHGRKKMKRAFKIRTRRGKENLLIRFGPKKKDVKLGYTTSPANILNNEQPKRELKQHAETMLKNRIEHETNRMLESL